MQWIGFWMSTIVEEFCGKSVAPRIALVCRARASLTNRRMVGDDNDLMCALWCVCSDVLDACFEPVYISLMFVVVVGDRPTDDPTKILDLSKFTLGNTVKVES